MWKHTCIFFMVLFTMPLLSRPLLNSSKARPVAAEAALLLTLNCLGPEEPDMELWGIEADMELWGGRDI